MKTKTWNDEEEIVNMIENEIGWCIYKIDYDLVSEDIMW